MLNYQDSSLDLVFHALADPTRRTIVDRLGRSAATVSELAEPLDLSLPGVLQHLKVLESSGLIRTSKTGRVRTCHLERSVLRTVEEWVAHRTAHWTADLDRLERYLMDEAESLTDDRPSPYAPSPSRPIEP